MRISRTIVSQVMVSKEAILSADAAKDERFEMSQSIADFSIRSVNVVISFWISGLRLKWQS